MFGGMWSDKKPKMIKRKTFKKRKYQKKRSLKKQYGSG